MFLIPKAVSYANPKNWCPRKAVIILVLFPLLITSVTRGGTQTVATDPGVRGSPAGAGAPIAGLTANQTSYFNAGLDDFMEIQSVLHHSRYQPRARTEVQRGILWSMSRSAGRGRHQSLRKPPGDRKSVV